MDPVRAGKDLAATIDFWQSWLARSETGPTLDPGPYKGMAERLSFAAGFLYDEAEAEYIRERAGTIGLSYQDYD